MGSVRGSGVWVAMVAAGIGLGALVLAAWPEPTTRFVRLPYGEVGPKTPTEVATAKPREVPRHLPRQVRSTVAAQPEETGRVLAVVVPEASPAEGPAPVPSELELSPGYVPESPEELGAEPLPGAELTPAPPPAAG